MTAKHIVASKKDSVEASDEDTPSIACSTAGSSTTAISTHWAKYGQKGNVQRRAKYAEGRKRSFEEVGGAYKKHAFITKLKQLPGEVAQRTEELLHNNTQELKGHIDAKFQSSNEELKRHIDAQLDAQLDARIGPAIVGTNDIATTIEELERQRLEAATQIKTLQLQQMPKSRDASAARQAKGQVMLQHSRKPPPRSSNEEESMQPKPAKSSENSNEESRIAVRSVAHTGYLEMWATIESEDTRGSLAPLSGRRSGSPPNPQIGGQSLMVF